MPAEPVAERPQLPAVPELEPEPEPRTPQRARAGARQPPTVVPIGVGAGPRQWNLWDLERLTRERSGGDAAQTRSARSCSCTCASSRDPTASLPVDFDGLVRDSFGELVGAR